ncbi:hypothetical protein NDU88_005091 [Pleurodeles waltl]|uniref:Uncharacterized protein n=1 Tax=Pleurodeles waltl TaxID=8319 RepID=A0AAV7LKE4_PLEWA|nr:hypothetical protein NDU88_005091 [Pleurodeles waltl]
MSLTDRSCFVAISLPSDRRGADTTANPPRAAPGGRVFLSRAPARVRLPVTPRGVPLSSPHGRPTSLSVGPSRADCTADQRPRPTRCPPTPLTQLPAGQLPLRPFRPHWPLSNRPSRQLGPLPGPTPDAAPEPPLRPSAPNALGPVRHRPLWPRREPPYPRPRLSKAATLLLCRPQAPAQDASQCAHSSPAAGTPTLQGAPGSPHIRHHDRAPRLSRSGVLRRV